ncbi:MAG: hypothetical protein QOI01_5116 [Mycobacterium sp.]|nr:hypothetical protein [Mycobacterium sp.]
MTSSWSRESHLIRVGRTAMGRSRARATAPSGSAMSRAVTASHESIVFPGAGASRSGSLLLGATAMQPKNFVKPLRGSHRRNLLTCKFAGSNSAAA